MRFPRPPYTPPSWYWRLPLKWRQRYCRWYIHRWESLYRFCTNILSCQFLFGAVPGMIRFSAYCLRCDRRDGIGLGDSIGYLLPYWRDCWRAWWYASAKKGMDK